MVSFGAYKIRHAVFWYSVLIAFLYIALPPARYLVYTVPFLVMLTILGDRKARIGDEAKPLLAFCLAGLALAPLATTEGMKDLFFVFAGVSIALLVDVPQLKSWNIFWLTVLAGGVQFAFFRESHAVFDFSLLASKSTLEGASAFVFGLLVIVALFERRYWLFILSAIMAVLALKRIALLGALIAATFVFLGEKRGKKILNPMVMILINSLLVGALLLYGSGAMDRLMVGLIGMSADQLGMGRETILSVPANAIIKQPHRFVAYGEGPGAGYNHLMNFHGIAKQNLHSDLVKIIYEYGYLAFCGFLWLMYSCKHYRLRILFLYVNVLFVTDNTLIYSFFLILFVALGRFVQQQDAPAEQTVCTNATRGAHLHRNMRSWRGGPRSSPQGVDGKDSANREA